MSRLENIQTFVRTLGNQFIKGNKHFSDDVFLSPNVSGDVASVYLTIDENGKVVSRTTVDVAADLGISGGTGNFMLRATYDTDNDGVVDKAERIDIRVRNNSGSLIPNGSVIYLNGSTGNRPTIALASATSEVTSSKTFGIVNGDIAHESDGYVTVLGTIHTLDTSEIVEGTNMWLDTTAGQMTSVAPQTPNHAVFLGVVTRSHPTAGSMVINIQNGFELGELHDVSASSPITGDLLRFDGSIWYNWTPDYITGYTETDPIFAASAAYNITNDAISNWNTAYNWGDHGSVGYLTSFTESDPTVPIHVKGIQEHEITNWNEAYGWGDHKIAGYLTSFTETDPIYTASSWYTTTNNSSNWDTAYGWGNHAGLYSLTSHTHNVFTQATSEVVGGEEVIVPGSNGFVPASGFDDTGKFLRADGTWQTVTTDLTGYATETWVGQQGYLTSYAETDPVFVQSAAYNVRAEDITAWNTAYEWGDHSEAGYLTAFTETDPIYTASSWYTTANNATNWDTAYGWGNHAGLYADLHHTHEIGDITELQDTLDRKLESETDPVYTGSTWYTTANNATSWDTAYGWGNHASAGYLTYIPTPVNGDWWNGGSVVVGGDGVMEMGKYMDFHTSDSGGNVDFDLRVTVSPGIFSVGGEIEATGGNSTQWNTAYGWGNHALAGYLTSETDSQELEWNQAEKLLTISNGNTVDLSQMASVSDIEDAGFITAESDTLATVVSRGSLTYNAISVAETTGGGYLYRTNSGWGSWARNGFSFADGSGTVMKSLGAYGNNGTSLGYMYLGTDYQTNTLRIYDDYVYVPGLDFAISNVNSSHSRPNYFRGDSSHFVIGTNGRLYLNYGGTDTYLTAELGFADYADNVRINKGSNWLNLRDSYNNIHLRNNISGYGVYIDSTSHYWRPHDGSSYWMTLSSNGLGIGTQAPAQKLDVNGNISLGSWTRSGSAYVGLRRADDGSFGGGGDSGLVIESYNHDGAWVGDYSQRVHLRTHLYNGGSHNVLTAYGYNVGIGTASPATKLQVKGGDILIDAGSWIKGVYSTETTYRPLFGISSDRNTTIVRAADNDAVDGVDIQQYDGTSIAYFRQGGNVGIGTTSPGGPLEIYKANSGGLGGHLILNNNGLEKANETAIMFNDSGVGSTNYVRAAISSTVEGSPYYGDLKFKTGLGDYSSLNTSMIITGAGNVGIGTTSPDQKLQVVGSIKANGTFYSYASTNANFSNTSANATFHQFESYWNTDAASSIATLRFDVGTWRLWSLGTSSDVLTVKSNGNVGIGITPESNERFSVNAAEGIWALSAYSSGVQIGGIHVNDSILNVQGSGGTEVRLSTSGNATWNGDVLATRTWVQAQGYLTSETDSQTLDWNQGEKTLTISNGNSVDLSQMASIQDVENYGFITGESDTLATVTARGATTNGNIVINGEATIQNSGYLRLIAGSSQISGFTVFNATQNGYLSNRITTGDHARGWGWEFTTNEAINDAGAVYFRVGYNGADSYLNSGNFGIGTTSPYPNAKLQVKTGANINVAVQTGTTNTSGIKINAFNDAGDTNIPLELNGSILSLKTGETERIHIDSGGNVGIGTAPNQGVRLQVSGAVDVWNSLNSLLRLEHDGTRGLIQSYTGGGYSSTALSPYGGNVGIGTTSPAYKLDVAGGDVRLAQDYSQVVINGITLRGYTADNLWVIGNSTRASINIGTSWDWDMQVAIAYTPNTPGAGQGGLAIGQTSKNNTSWTHGSTSFYTLGEERMSIDSGGNVYLNTHLFAYEDISYTRLYRPNGAAGIYLGGAGDASNYYDNDYHYFRNSGASANLGVWNSTGLGIGTTSPDGKLDVRGAAKFRGSLNGVTIVPTATGGNIYVYESDAPKVYIESAGHTIFNTGYNFGIGTTSPSEKLHVNGAAIFDGGAGNSSTDSVLYVTKSNNNDWGLYVNASGLDYGMYTRVSPTAEYAFAIHNGSTWTTRITGSGVIYLGEKNAIEGASDSWLRLNNQGHYTSGVYTPGVLRNDGNFVNYGGIYGYATIRGRKAQTDGDYTTAALWTESYDNTTTGIAFHISGVVGKFLEMRTNGSLYWDGAPLPTQAWVTSQGYTSTAYVDEQIAALVDSAPEALNTLKELSNALGDDQNFATNVTNSIAGKVSKSGDTMTGNLSVAGNTDLGNSVGSTLSSTHTTKISGYAMRYDASNRYGNYGVLILNSDSGWTGSARKFMLTSGLNTNRFAIIRSVDADTDPAFGDGGVISSGTADFVIDNSGNIGIGTTSPSYKLETIGNARISGNLSIGTTYNAFAANIEGTVYVIGASVWVNDGYGYANASSSTGMYPDSSHNITFKSNNSTKVYINAAGNVGIGTTSPSTKLEVGNFLDAVTNKITVAARYEYEPEFNFRLGQSGTNLDWIGAVISSGDDGNYNGKILFKTANGGRDVPTTKMAIKANGNVGIGTINPSSRLHVYENADVWHARFGSDAGELRIGGQTSSGAVIQAYTPAGVVRDLYIQRDGGNVGIGTTTITKKLEVAGDSASGTFRLRPADGIYQDYRLDITAQAANDGAVTMAIKENIFLKTYGYYNLNGLSLGVAGYTDLIHLRDSGNVGIGTTSPTYKLDVAGTVNSDAYRLSGGFTMSNMGGYAEFNNWVHLPGTHGFYSSINGAHIYPNNGSYGAWRIVGSRNGYNGFEFDSSNGQISLMVNTNSNTTGFHNNSYGWQFRWENGTLYCNKNSYGGGTSAVVLDSSNYTSYALSVSGGTVSNYLNVDGAHQGGFGIVTIKSSDPALISMETTSNSWVGLRMQTEGNFDWAFFGKPSDVNDKIVIDFGFNTTNEFVFDSSGNLTIAGTFSETSARRYKENIVDLEPVTDKVYALRPVRYNKIGTETQEIGLIAEEVAELFPEVVHYNDEGQPESLNYTRLSVLLLQTVKELSERIQKLENK